MKILIVDDNCFSKEFIRAFFEQVLKCDIEYFCTPSSYESALVYLKDNYTFALFDYRLIGEIGDDNPNGYDLFCKYKEMHPEALAFLYSSEYYKVNKLPNIKTTCLSNQELQDMLRYHVAHQITKSIDKEIFTMTQSASSMAIPYSEKLCDERHEKDREDHNAIKKAQSDYEAENRKSHDAITNGITQFKIEVKQQNDKMFKVVLAGVSSQIVTTIAILTFVFLVLSKIKIAG